MKTLLIAVGLCLSIASYSQKFTVGIVKTGNASKNVEGQIIVTDTTVTTIIDDETTTLKITRREGHTIHVTDGTSAGKFVVGHTAGKLHGFNYDRHIHYHEKHHNATPTSIYYCVVNMIKQ